MSHLKCIHSFKAIPKIIRRSLFVSKKSLCSKKIEDINVTIKLEEGGEDKQKPGTILVEHDQDAKTIVVTERGKDASVKSRLSKEYNKLLTGKTTQVLNIKDGFKLIVDVDEPQSSLGRDKTLDKTITKLSKNTKKKKPSSTGDKSLDKTITKLKDTFAMPPTPPTKGPPPKKGGIVRQEPGEVILAFIPREWFTLFIPITGVTGFGTFLFTTGTYLVSKEYYVLEHNYYGGLSMAIMVAAAIRYIGPGLAKYLDKEIQEYEDGWNQMKQRSVAELNESIDTELHLQFQADGNLMLVDAKRENVHLQLENEFRKRQVRVNEEVKRLLDYNAAVGDIQRKIHQKNLVDYVSKHVMSSFTPEMQTKLINVSIDNLMKELNKIKEIDDKSKEGSVKNDSKIQ